MELNSLVYDFTTSYNAAQVTLSAAHVLSHFSDTLTTPPSIKSAFSLPSPSPLPTSPPPQFGETHPIGQSVN